MNQSNSKLTAEEKSILKGMRENDTSVRVVTDNFRTVIAYTDAGNGLVKFAVSVMSPDEKKFRLKVGEFHARERLNYGEFAILPYEFFEDMCDTHDILSRQAFRDLESENTF